ncbi:MAG TPA: Mur ligase family protein [Alphaproteobacteria bacterium]|jgi:UDP-N-acetylmuramoyl-L-alanyl-D-glutamate--2,6-diaminopimelate ligase|nr:Mur ligase family protein [Alphaproteobacteria bacterium]
MGKILGVTNDSRKVKPGWVFVAVKGLTVDGHDYIDEARKNGAVEIYQGKNSRERLGELASEFYGNPSSKLKVIGVTGTKGKTTTCHLIYHILTKLGKKVGLISSITTQGFHTTTPDVISLNQELAKMVKNGYEYAVIEVSSHAIHQKRVVGVNFEVGVLTNIAPEHLDYHKTFKEYKKVKMSFINSCRYKVISPGETDLNILPGKFNNLNVEAAVHAVEFLGINKQEALKTLDSFDLPEGRLEEMKNDKGFKIFIDFAHTPDSLKAALTYLKTLTHGKLISVFGCAGERDHKKRSKMGNISTQVADLSIFTAEDPRSENVFNILRQIKQNARGNFVCIPERGEAIAYALSIARKGDTLAFLGKGHEKTMAYGKFENPWSDKEAIYNCLNADITKSVIVLAAGKGSRMKSNKPKVIHEICGRPMISYSLENLRRAGFKDIVVVTSFRKNLVKRIIQGAVKIAFQKNPKGGTADAAESGFKLVSKDSKVIVVINGDDSAFYTPETIKNVIGMHQDKKSVLTFVSLEKENPIGLGRVLRDKKGNVSGIVEEKNTTDEQKKIREVNDGLYVFDKNWLTKNLPAVKKNEITGERYITELIEMAISKKESVSAYKLPNPDEWQGINTPEELEKAQEKMTARLNNDKN